jgi:hypothetical protein
MDTIETHHLDPTRSLFEEAYATPNDSEVLPDFMESFFAPDPQEPLVDFDFAASDATLHDKGTISDVKTNLPKPHRPLRPRDAPGPTGVQAPLMFAPLPNGCPDSAINAGLINDIYNRLMTLENSTPTFRQVFDISTRLTRAEARQMGIENRQTEMEFVLSSMDGQSGDLNTPATALQPVLLPAVQT